MTWFNSCRACGWGNAGPGTGKVAAPGRGWKFWRKVTCPKCGGDGMAKPPGWPDRAEMERLRPKMVPPAPPRGGSGVTPGNVRIVVVVQSGVAE